MAARMSARWMPRRLAPSPVSGSVPHTCLVVTPYGLSAARSWSRGQRRRSASGPQLRRAARHTARSTAFGSRVGQHRGDVVEQRVPADRGGVEACPAAWPVMVPARSRAARARATMASAAGPSM